MNESKRILVTGGAGFIGSNLIKKLLNESSYIIVLDNLYTGNLSNIKDFLNNKNFEFINGDIINPIDIKVDEIYNLACPASPPKYQKDPIFTFRTAVFGTYNLLNLAKKYNAKFLQASTSEVYGNPLTHPQTEEYSGNVNFTGIRACYNEGKRAAETLIGDFKRQHNIKAKIARIFNTYGPNMSKFDGRVVSNFINQALKNEDITIYGKGSQTRSFCYVDETVDALIKLMETDDSINYPINIGNPCEYTILETAEIILELTNSKSKITHKEIPEDDPLVRKPDISKAKNILKWEPKISFKEGLKKTIEYYKTEN